MTGFSRLFLIFFLFIFFQNSQAQNNDFEAGLFNVGIGSVLGGIGAVINKEPQEKFGKTLLKGLGQGALGGYLVFESKRLVREFAKSGNYGYVWPSKIVNSAGTSIIENAAANRDFWTRWHLNIGFNRFEVYTNESFKMSYRIMPFAFYSAVANATEGDFNLRKSLKLGTFVFTANEIKMPNGKNASGFNRTNSIVVVNNLKGASTEAHEIIHTYQYESFSGINSFLDRNQKNFSNHSKIYKKYSKIFYTDFNAIFHSGLYVIETWNAKKYKDNFFEEEAFYFSSFN